MSRRHRLAYDRAKPSAKSLFLRARKAEVQYARQLRKVARHIGDLVMGLFDQADPTSAGIVERALRRYAGTIEAWASSVGGRMVAEVAARDRKAWMAVSREMGTAIHREIEQAPTGALLRQRLADQVSLITSLPTEAAERVHQLTIEGLSKGTRASEIAAEIMRSGEVSAARANLIARTEVSRTATDFTEARAQSVGSEGYIWRTAGDSDVRDSHRAMAGKYVEWKSPPTLDGMTGHAGQFPNCRCYPEPVIPDV
ncbi:phage minor head protein [Bosea sp. RCC_152_1]|uniref:phage head morphogenesis protein n=1 Tax=Bosea sp. RCC_152_1 TaxID=3239228 RepID=UPI0035247A7D